ncbi:hypothetical protein [Rathayibacter iranicus]|uniref:Uncharacterized protein n=2 Tax=Rathayibacter iranicus TaxID=59737 RepID=A0AAD1EM46_9MICO|nr:hypothetical protein [Rathayibacter iranicus]AZZ55726.1 hypothetical protein C7V51_07420 [Rathayibacter iranicus]MWV32088.1 hypothetical protein [Rathayibacter iranicus NCPPB 2253 = VKM Ac-1602]PPI60597.1 hypothetical protein C5E08_07385 [Rathayibacter iranicus]PWJ61835.1 hypothetical protein B0H03_11436 [Rathayibacter iranicus NCPPB 2253 = VKM Ac-1602]
MRRDASLITVVLITLAILAIALITRFPLRAQEERLIMTPQQTRIALVSFVRDSTQQLDIDGWWPRNGPASPSDCTFANGDPGAVYDFDLLAPRGPDERTDPTRAAIREHSADVVADYWRSLGMTVTILSTDARYPTVYADGGPVHRASFATDGPDDSYFIGATSICVPGNADELLDDDDAKRAAGVVLPGDEGTIDRNDPRWSEMSKPRP